MGTFISSSRVISASVLLLSLLYFCFDVYGLESCLKEERIALVQLRDSLSYQNRVDLAYHWVGDNCCDWRYITCDSTHSVISISLGGLDWRPSFISFGGVQFQKWYSNASLFTHFKKLQSLDLSVTNLGGWIMPQALCELRNLKTLDLSLNSLGDEGLPSCHGHGRGLTYLKEINLSENSNNLSTPLLSALCGLKNLRKLDLSNNVLSNGNLPPCMLDTFSTLESLDLSNITLEESSNVFIALQGARNLRELTLWQNNLNDRTMGALCGALTNLRTLDLSYSNISVQRVPPCLQQYNSSLEYLALDGTLTKNTRALLKGLACGRNKLKILSLSSSHLSDEDLPSCLFYNDSMLQCLDLSRNDLRGSHGFATGLCKLRKLQYLSLGNNSIQKIPWTCLSQLNSLQYLDLSQNKIVGTMPPFISNLTSLGVFDLFNNELEGVVFFSMFANLSKLDYINLSNNRDLEVKTDFPTWIPSFQLNFLELDNCKLRNIPRFLDTQYNLGKLSLSYNSLQGEIPSWLLYNATHHPLDYLSIRSNQLHGSFPLPFENETSKLQSLDISSNDFQGLLPGNMDVLFPNLQFLNMSENNFQGCIPPSFGNLINLYMLDLSNNYIFGEVPLGLTQNNTLLLHLALSKNKLHALQRFFNMTNLRTLSLDGNLFTRLLPFTPSSVPSLVFLDISGNSMLGNIQDWLLPTAFPNLISLVMRENHFVGCLPQSLCQMHNLRVLDLSDNDLSGAVPSCINNITSWLKESQADRYFGFVPEFEDEEDTYYINFATKRNLYRYKGLPLYQMTGIDLSLNQLSGAIPSQMGELAALHSLNLSHNYLIGYLPQSFQELKLVESLDLSHNKLVGMIPPQLIQLFYLSTFSVAFNQLSGRIPYENNFATFTKECYIGNSGLCGPPIEVNCSSPQSHPNEHKEGDDKEQSLLDNKLFFYSYVAICFLLGFWAIIAPLLLSRNWRKKYYRVVDRCIDWCSDWLFWCLYYIKKP